MSNGELKRYEGSSKPCDVIGLSIVSILRFFQKLRFCLACHCLTFAASHLGGLSSSRLVLGVRVRLASDLLVGTGAMGESRNRLGVWFHVLGPGWPMDG